ncbi:MAG: PEPxxWA-CTERM sorting domain-containing protein [Phenylobacterium sp.]|uniref:PEPxxWA-CTERM sorting domain-containing protein n=1 Tax=Phenylobacterium sp. TaxID=1871053 RepID=UPI0027324E52|nr:PEPxxWA-CTERM sorting domain-containing protein [Phenylobacterium sp.]MDP3747930.1 PEPxxWA-CTERM sorting domain-containing protein [Phenylobacterium sp.]
MLASVKPSAAALFGAALICATPSQAATVIQSASFDRAPHAEVIQHKPPADIGVTEFVRAGTLETQVHFAGFDQTLGTLTGVRVQLASTQDFSGGLSIVGGGSAYATDLDYSSSVEFGGQSVWTAGSYFFLDDNIYCLTQGAPFCLNGTKAIQSFGFDVAALDLNPFLAPGGVDLGLKSIIDLDTVIYGMTGGSILTSSAELNWDGDLRVVYTYDPAIVQVPTGVPEPASWAMMIVGFGLSGAALRRTRRSGHVAVS